MKVQLSLLLASVGMYVANVVPLDLAQTNTVAEIIHELAMVLSAGGVIVTAVLSYLNRKRLLEVEKELLRNPNKTVQALEQADDSVILHRPKLPGE